MPEDIRCKAIATDLARELNSSSLCAPTPRLAWRQRPSRSLKHEYALYLEREIENYKESVPRSVLLSIGDDAVRALAEQQQFALTELLAVRRGGQDHLQAAAPARLRRPGAGAG